MNRVAVIIGIDDYAGRPLTSAVNDALAFRKCLIDHRLVAEDKIDLLTSPPHNQNALPATAKNIRDVLYKYYVNGSDLDRFYFHFAGHGLLAYSNSAKTRMRTALLPSDVQDLDKDGALLIDFTELMDVSPCRTARTILLLMHVVIWIRETAERQRTWLGRSRAEQRAEPVLHLCR